MKVLKEELIDYYLKKKRKRNKLLYEYYKDALFKQDFSADYIAEKISQDLGIKISKNIIYSINKRILKKDVPVETVPLKSSPIAEVSSEGQMGKKVVSTRFTNIEGRVTKNPFEGLDI